MKSLELLAGRFRSAEAKVVKAYFARPREKKEHIRWLKAQAFKEHSAIKPLLQTLAKTYPHLDRGMDRHQYVELGEKLAEEMNHARLIMDLLDELTGTRITPKDLLWLSEDKRLAKIRGRYSKTYSGLLHGSENIKVREIRRKDEDLERAAITLTEGGGGALYEVCSRLKAGRFERKVAAAFKEIYLDEVNHKNAGARDLARLVTSRRNYERARKIIQQVSGQRLRMRNEQFGFPLSARKIRSLELRCGKPVGPLATR
jgi:hypothetical protein